MSDPPIYDSVKKESLNGVVTEAIGTYLQVNRISVRENIKKEIITLGSTFTAIEDDFAKITPEIRSLDDSQVLDKPRLQDWQDLHNVCRPLWVTSVV